MTEPLPEVSSPITLNVDGTEHDSRVEKIDGKTIVVAAPLHESVEVPALGFSIGLSWSAGPRGQYLVETRLVSTSRVEGVPGRAWTLTIEAEPVLHQRRRYARAGGGEPVRVRATGRDAMVQGNASDISEGGVRFRVAGVRPDDDFVRLDDGEAVSVVVQLDEDMLDADGAILRTIDDRISNTVDMIVTLKLTERQAELVRRYVMRQQILARRAAANQ